MTEGTHIKEWRDVTADRFHAEIVTANQPAVMRGLVSDWPLVQAARRSESDALRYMKSLASDSPLYTIVGGPEIQRRFFYGAGLRGANFKRAQSALGPVLDNLVALKGRGQPHALAVQAASVQEAMPGFDQANAMPLLPATVAPTLWLGNSAVVAPHFDVSENVACVAVGRRAFTLFPPDQVANLYVGPTLDAPGGVPISMVDLANPDLEAYPRFAEALAVAQRATLEPGDAIFIPTPWWHAVESLEPVNALINYWWGGLEQGALSPNHSLLHAMLTIANLNPAQRSAWRHFFDYFVFRVSGDPAEHLPDDIHDIATTLSPQQREAVYRFLSERLR